MNRVWLNGEPADAITVFDRGLAYGHGLFETIRIHEHKAPLIEYHMQRLEKGCRALGIPCNREKVVRHLNGFLADKPAEGVAKISVTAGVGGRGYLAPTELVSNVILQWHELPKRSRTPDKGVVVRLCEYRLPSNPALAGIKHLNRLDQVLARSEWSDPEIDEGIVLDQQGWVVESVSSNLFAFFPGQGWVTPDLNDCGVSGVMRRVVIERLLENNVEERKFTPQELAGAETVILCNSVQGIRSVDKIIDLADYQGHQRAAELQQALGELYPCYRS